MNVMQHQDLNTLERLVDIYGLHDVLSGLAWVCQQRSTLVQNDWQEPQGGHQWERWADALHNLRNMPPR